MLVSNQGIWRRVLIEHGLELFVLLLWFILISLLYHQLEWQWLSISPVPLTIIGAALGIVLGFRGNEAYNRYNEARTLWGAIVNSCRTLTRQILTLLSSEPNADCRTLQQEVVHLSIAFAHALRCQLWRRDAADVLQPVVPDWELPQLMANRNIPDAILHSIANRIQMASENVWIHPVHVKLLHESLRDLSNAQGGCERIKNAPIPRSYTFVSHKLVIAYCIAVPFGLVGNLSVAMPAAALLISFVYLMLNRFAKLIEDPFCTTYSGLPLLAICRTIEINLRQRLGETNLPEDLKPVDNVLA